MPTIDELRLRGEAGETALKDWFQNQGLSFVSVCQSRETFATLFGPDVKRPDFLLLLESIGMIAVDAKNKTLSRGEYTLNLETELRRAVAFERIFRLPLWYAYQAENNRWHWISALKAVEVGTPRERRGSPDERFLAIKLKHFEEIGTGMDIAKLYTHRLPGYSRIADLPSNAA
jgi:hypothetical protein